MSFVDLVNTASRPHADELTPPVAACPRCEGDARAVRGQLDLVLPLRHAGTRAVRIAYEAVGPADAPAVFVAHGGFDRVRDHRDLTDRPRFVTARRTAAVAGWPS